MLTQIGHRGNLARTLLVAPARTIRLLCPVRRSFFARQASSSLRWGGTAIAVVQAAMIEVGQTVGNYVVTALLGEGGMGKVFLAEHPVIGRKVALKVIHPEFSHNVEMVSRFVNEAKTISQIGHEHVVEVTDFGRTSGDDFYFIMEHLEGEALSEPIERGAPFPPARAIMIAAQIADALGPVHERGVVHCDLKPENVFLVDRGGTPDFVKVLDFGLAKLTRGGDAEPRKTHAGSIMGTPSYMSPEQCDGRNAVDARADVYALGVILFEMLTGKLPFGGDTSDEIIVKQVTMHAPAARAIVPDLPEELDFILQRALAKAPAERFPTMAAFRAALVDLRRHVGAEPRARVYDDMSGRVQAARPMRGAEIARRHSIAVVAAIALGAMAFVAEPAYGNGFWQRVRAAAARFPATIGIIAASDPHGAPIVVPAEPARDAPAEIVFGKAGYLPETISTDPNVSSPLFALVQETSPRPVAAEPSGTPRGSRAVQAPHRTRRHARNMDPRDVGTKDVDTNDVDTNDDNTDGDDVLPPSYR
jgi:eukaryotic-like serine/threonine-protein kinase